MSKPKSEPPVSKMQPVLKSADPAMAERVGQVIDETGGFTVAEKRLGISDAQLRRYVSAISDIPTQRLRAIAEYGGVSLDWLVYGAGPILSTISNEAIADKNEDLAMIPVLNIEAAAGAGAVNGDALVVEHVPFARAYLKRQGAKISEVRGVRAKGESMSPTIESGSLLLIDQSQRDLVDDGIFVVSLGDEVRIKRIHKTLAGRVTLKSDNENKQLYPDETLDPSDLERMKVAGRVFWADRVL